MQPLHLGICLAARGPPVSSPSPDLRAALSKRAWSFPMVAVPLVALREWGFGRATLTAPRVLEHGRERELILRSALYGSEPAALLLTEALGDMCTLRAGVRGDRQLERIRRRRRL